jgi:hypothetical protein
VSIVNLAPGIQIPTIFVIPTKSSRSDEKALIVLEELDGDAVGEVGP